jgi:ligand-binding sensor domain-containing protein
MNKLLAAVVFSAALSGCSKKNDIKPSRDFGISFISWHLIDEIEGVGAELAFRLHIDHDGTLWVGTFGNGLIRIGNEVKVYTTENSDLPNDTIWSITSDNNGVVWGGPLNGLFKLEGESFQVYDTANSAMVVNHIFAIGIDHSNNVWFGNGNAEEGGLMKFDQVDEWTLFTPENSDLPTGIVNAVHIDGAGAVWTGHGMFRGAGGIWTRNASGIEKTYTIDNSNLEYNWARRIKGDKNGTVWVGTDAPIFLDGITLFGSVQEFQGDDFISHNPSNSGRATNRTEDMDFDDLNNLWVATGLDAPTFNLKNEVSIYNKSRWTTLSKEFQDFPDLRVTDIAIHGDNVWMATASGLINVKISYF